MSLPGGLRCAAAFTLTLALAACQTARMPLPQELSASQRLSVEGRQGVKIRERLRFGTWEAADVDRSWIRGRDIPVQQLERNRRREELAFELREAGTRRATARCETSLLLQGIHLPRGGRIDPDDRSTVSCAIAPTGGGASWHLDLSERQGRTLEGVLRADATEIQVSGTDRLEGGRLPAGFTTGYTLGVAGRTVAAVEVLNDGAVWLHPSIDPDVRAAVAAAAAALLLIADLRETLDET